MHVAMYMKTGRKEVGKSCAFAFANALARGHRVFAAQSLRAQRNDGKMYACRFGCVMRMLAQRKIVDDEIQFSTSELRIYMVEILICWHNPYSAFSSSISFVRSSVSIRNLLCFFGIITAKPMLEIRLTKSRKKAHTHTPTHFWSFLLHFHIVWNEHTGKRSMSNKMSCRDCNNRIHIYLFWRR